MSTISETEKAKIEDEAREILKKFNAALAKVNVKVKKKEEKEEAERGWREEKAGMKGDTDFRKRMLANAPEHDEDVVIAERKKWQ